jgi:hypothetical protein
LFGTPYTEKLHVVERYRLVDYEDAKDAMQRGTKENRRAAGPYDPNYKDKYLRVLFTIEDEGAFTTPRKRSAPKTGFHSITIRMQTSRMRTSRISERTEMEASCPDTR